MALTRDEIQARIEASDGPVDLSGLDLRGADLSRLDLRGAKLARADLSSADLRWTVLEGADLQACVLRRADARWAILRSASLRQADLTRANLGWADLAGADLTSAELDGTTLDNVDLSEVLVDRPKRAPARRAPAASGGWSGIGALGGSFGALRARLPGGASLPTASPATLAAAAITLLALTQLWGWLYRRAYFLRAFELREAGVVGLADGANLAAGMLHVIGMTVLLVLLSPVIVLALALVLGAILVVPLAFYWLAQRLLRDVVRSPGRPLLIGGLFVSFFVVFYLLIPEAVAAAGRFRGALPVGGRLSAVTELWAIGGWIRRIGLLAVLFGAAYPMWLLLRTGVSRLRAWNVPAAWRLRYPVLNAAVVNLRARSIMQALHAVEPDERGRGIVVTAGLIALLATLIAGIGEVHAYRDMCDGGDLPRVQAYRAMPDGETIRPMINPRVYCTRLVAETEDAYYVFFPCQTESLPDGIRRESSVVALDVEDVGLLDRTISEHECPTCVDGCLGTERDLVDPSEERVYGPLATDAIDSTTGLIAVDSNDSTFDGVANVVDASEAQLVFEGASLALDDGETLLQRAAADGRTLYIEAFGRLEGEVGAGFLDATRGRIFDPTRERPEDIEVPGGDGPSVPRGGVFTVDLSDPRNPVFEGSGWRQSQALEIAVVEFPQGGDPLAPENQSWSIHKFNVPGADGSFSVPLSFNPQWPVGVRRVDPETQQVMLSYVVARDTTTGEATAFESWLADPPPTFTPTPSPIPTIVREDTPAPTEDPDAEPTATPTPVPTFTPNTPPTNTPFPGLSGGPSPGISPTCTDPDEFEFDDGRGFQKEIRVGLGAGNAPVQSRNFCSPFDLDLAYFPVKSGRWYRVFTQNLGPGVDTVMAVGDLATDTDCRPFHPTFGCWSDDKGTLTFESEIIFQARADQTAIITVDNRGSGFGAEAGYELGVEMFEPDSTVTPTLEPTRTATATKTPSASPTAEKDSYEIDGDICNPKAPVIRVGQRVRALLENDSDDDYFLIDLEAGVEYVFSLTPPGDADYDMDVLSYNEVNARSANCNILFTGIASGGEYLRWTPSTTTRYAVHVYTQRRADTQRSYELLVSYYVHTDDEATLTALAPPPTSTPTPTRTPWTPPPPPTPIPATSTPTGTPLPPPLLPGEDATATPTWTVTPGVADAP